MENINNSYPFFITDSQDINNAYRLALSTLAANTLPFKDGILEDEEPVFIAGLKYYSPWTRDAAINTWNGGGLIAPRVAYNTLRSVMGKDEKGYFIDGEYWDRIILTVGAWWYYIYNGDRDFLAMSYDAVENSLKHFEETEYSEELGLFRGAACYGDGVSAYPDIYAKHGYSGIIFFSKDCRELCEDTGVGIPMYALSTNCLYYEAYVLADKMARELGLPEKYAEKAEKMKNAINRVFWNEEAGNYRYLHDKFGGCDSLEGLGLCFAILFGIADEEKREKIFKNTTVTKEGIACVYPSFSRYDSEDGMSFGRHSGTVWPHVQGFWADAAAKHGERGIFDFEFSKQTEHTVRAWQFSEIYHPVTGEIYGGVQEKSKSGIRAWDSVPVQTWSATAYLRQVYFDILGMKLDKDGITFEPVCTKLVKKAELKGLKYRNAVLNITLSGSGDRLVSFKLNGKEAEPHIDCDITGENNIELVIG